MQKKLTRPPLEVYAERFSLFGAGTAFAVLCYGVKALLGGQADAAFAACYGAGGVVVFLLFAAREGHWRTAEYFQDADPVTPESTTR